MKDTILDFSPETRTKHLREFAAQTFDLAIIGGGITGAGMARDAASRGMKVALIEANDFASGTSSRSSKLVHGGIRYLENLEFHLVFEALSERALLFRIAPHLVHPLRFLLPLYRGGRVGMFKMGLGMWLYDILSMFEAPEMHERLDVDSSLQKMPVLRQKDLLGSYVYSDAYMDDDRLVIETLRSAHQLGAKAANYVLATGADFNQGTMSGLRCRDQITGNDFTIRANHYVSTVGPWTDELGSKILSDWKKIMRPAKGIHLTLAKEDLPLSCAVVMASDKDNRIVFGIPRHEMVIVGTTDTDYRGRLEEVHSETEDVRYLLKILNEYFPGAAINEEKILASYAGVRPLVDDGATTESKTSREHVIINDPRNISFIAGGKYTTYRRMAEQAVETCLGYFSFEDRAKFSRSNTKQALNPLITEERYHAALNNSEKWAARYKVSLDVMKALVFRHGEEGLEILEKYRNGVSINHPWALEAAAAIDQTMCLSLRDFYLRRAPLFLSLQDHGLGLLEELSHLFSNRLGWNDAKRRQEVQLLMDHHRVELGWKGQIKGPSFS